MAYGPYYYITDWKNEPSQDPPAILSYCFNCISTVLCKLILPYKTSILNKWETISHKL